ncbi:PDDEXK nuclease domain-containing protein [Lonepinella koalarum]|uniref:PDDEXK nuclease domain-containing protein n=1 Tax=Lonepinella koalarum TaxID=53417 RepID=UPI003F6E15A4
MCLHTISFWHHTVENNMDNNTLPSDYTQWLAEIKQRVAQARHKAVLAVNTELVCLYWQIGREILERQAQQGWGSKVIDRLGRDLREAFPDMKGFSRANLMYMRAFAETWSDFEFVQQAVGQLPWGHNVLIITRLKSADERLFYVQKSLSEHWSRTTLEVQIKNNLHQRQGKAVTNFNQRLPDIYSTLAQETLKDPYLFDFLGLGEDAQEREIEDALVRHVTRFLLELGSGFAYIGRQYRLEVNGDEFFIDLLFYHTRLKSYVVVELKATAFKPEHAGQLNFYLATVDAQIKADDDNPTIGLLLCRTQNRLVAEYALSGIDKPIGVAEYELVRHLPENLQSSLPTVGQLEAELGDFELGD